MTIEMLGKTFGELTVISRAENNKHGQAKWNCECSCGNTRVVLGQKLRTGKAKVCLEHKAKCCNHGHEMSPENTNSKGYCKACRAIANKSQIEKRKSRGVFSEVKRRYRLHELGWTPELWDKAWTAQEEKCSICKKKLNLEPKQNEARACADHAHDTLSPRDILCTNCNAMIGQAKENPGILRAGAEYLEKFSLQPQRKM